MRFHNYEEDEDEYDDEDGPRRRGRIGKSKLLKSIKRRISVAKPMGVLSRRSQGSEEEDDYSSDEDGAEFGFLKRHLKKKTLQQGSGNNSRKSRSKSPQSAKKKRGSLHKKEKGGLAAKGGRLRASLGLTSSKDANDEGDDVAMPLPGQKGSDARSVGTSRSTSSKRSTNKKVGFRRIKKALVKSNTTSSGGTSNNIGNNGSTTNNKSTKSSSIKKSRRRRKSTGSDQDRSVDSPPSVASTENSVDLASRAGVPHQHAQLQQQARLQRRKEKAEQKAKGQQFPGLFGRRDPDDETGANMEAMSMDYYYQSIPWIIKTWIYFLTVVVPFTLLYYCFVGIFHSTTMHRIPFLQHVAIANMLFAGLGCNFRSDFWARQARDSKGVLAKRPYATPGLERRNTPGMNGAKRLPRRNRSFNKNGRNSPTNTNGGIMKSLPRVDTLRILRPRRKSLPQNNNSYTSSIMSNRLTNASDRGTPSSRRPSGMLASSSSNHHNNADASSAFSIRRRPSSPTTSRPDARSGFITPSSPLGNASSNNSVWDNVENMIPSRKQNKSTNKAVRPSIDKHLSIMEIYQVHAKDEKVALLQ